MSCELRVAAAPSVVTIAIANNRQQVSDSWTDKDRTASDQWVGCCSLVSDLISSSLCARGMAG